MIRWIKTNLDGSVILSLLANSSLTIELLLPTLESVHRMAGIPIIREGCALDERVQRSGGVIVFWCHALCLLFRFV